MTQTLPVYVGYDAREHAAWQVCRYSIASNAEGPAVVHAMRHRELRAAGLFRREWKTLADGQMIDLGDGRPCSTEFSFTRFLVPSLAREKHPEADWALFVDCDFLFLSDVTRLLKAADPSKAVMCVQHDWERIAEGTKMDGVAQQRYRRKLWSSLMLFNMRHPAVMALTPELVNAATGGFLHGFDWLSDDALGALPTRWNWVPGVSPRAADHRFQPAAVHFSLGGPWQGISPEPWGQMWRNAYHDMMSARVENLELMNPAFGDFA